MTDYIFMQDNDSLWYLIPLDQQVEFEKCLIEIYKHHNYDLMPEDIEGVIRVNGPDSIIIHSWRYFGE